MVLLRAPCSSLIEGSFIIMVCCAGVARPGGALSNKRRGHQAVSCVMLCFACGGAHKYFECMDEKKYHIALRQANRNRVLWRGYNPKAKAAKAGAGMKPSGVGKKWVRQPWDPEYTPKRDVSPKRACLDKKSHISNRTSNSLRGLWQMSELDVMTALIDGGFLTDECLSDNGIPIG